MDHTDVERETSALDRTADLERVFTSFRRPLVSYVSRRFRGDSDDIVDEVFLIAVRKQSTLPFEDDQLRAWLFACARRVIANRVRWRARLDRFSALSTPLAESTSAPDRERDLAVHQALAAMRERDRELLLLVEWDGASVAVAAQVLDLPLSTVTNRLKVARESFARAFSRFATEQGGR